jgi:hypothetical protein
MAKANDDVQKMDDKELMKEWTSLGKQVVKDRERLTAFSHEHQKRTRLAQLNLTPGDIDLLQSMDPAAIESAESVMTGEDN